MLNDSASRASRPRRDAHTAASASDPLSLVSWGLLITSASIAYARLYIGVDFLDESFYVALPYAFSLGHRPFLDELAIHQTSALLLVPAVKTYLAIVQSNEGLVLFVRHLHFISSLIAAFLTARYLRSIVGKPSARMIAASILLFAPASIASMSYNTIAGFGLLAGSMLLMGASRSRRPELDLFVGASMLAWSTFAYPTLVVASIGSVGVALLLYRRGRPQARLTRPLLAVGTAGLIVLIASIAAGLYAGSESISTMSDLNAALGTQGGGSAKFKRSFARLALEQQLLASTAVALAVYCGVLRWIPRTWAAASMGLLVGPILILADQRSIVVSSPAPFVLWVISLAAVPLLVAERRRFAPQVWLELCAITLISLLSGLTIGWSSAMGLPRGCTGLVPAMLVFFVLVKGPQETIESTPGPTSALPIAALIASMLAFFAYERWTYIYAESPIAALTETIQHGAYRGLRTSPENATLIAELTADIDHAREHAETLLVYDDFPAGYLLSDLRPRTGALWMFSWRKLSYGNRRTRQIYHAAIADGDPPDLIVHMKSILVPFEKKILSRLADPVRRMFPAQEYPIVVDRRHYVITRRRAESQTAPVE